MNALSRAPASPLAADAPLAGGQCKRFVASLGASTRALVGVGIALHLILAVTLGLSPDEAHYALYGAHLDWSYFDHPPLVGWLQAPFVELGGADGLMRVVPMAAWVATVALAIVLCRRLPLSMARPESPHAATRRDDLVVALLLLSPLLDLIGVALVPDTLLLPLALAAMSTTWTLRDATRAAPTRAWVALGLILALSILAKYTGVFIVGATVVVLFRFHRKRLFRFPGFWLALAMTLAGSAPILGWNISHRWMSIAYQAGHLAGGRDWSAIKVARALLVQLVMYGPLLAVPAISALRQDKALEAVSPRQDLLDISDARALVLLYSLPVLVTAMALSGSGSALPHWTACGWSALVPLAVAGRSRLGQGWMRGLVAWQVLFLGTLLVTLWVGGIGRESGNAAVAPAGEPQHGKSLNPVADLYGWDEAAARASGIAQRHSVRALAVMNWSLASRLAWYARPLPVVVVPARADQFQLWFGTLRPGDSVLVVDWSQMSFAPPQSPSLFARCTPVDRFDVVRAGRQIAHFNYLLCSGWHGVAA